MLSFTKREQIVILIFVIIVISAFVYGSYMTKDMELIKGDIKNEETDIINTNILTEVNENIEANIENIPQKIIVHIDGEVMNPGVVELNEGARVIDVVNIAGGLTEYADEKRINLAQKLHDEEKIYIPKVGEDVLESEVLSSSLANNIQNNSQGKININTATKEELEKLSGIGPVLAERIIEYRQNNKFSSIDDIKKVSGIGSKKFDSIKENITIK